MYSAIGCSTVSETRLHHTVPKLLIAAGMLLGLPLAGVLWRGHRLATYVEFPPLTQYVEHAAFCWVAFAVVAVADIALLGALAWASWRGRRVARGEGNGRTSCARHTFPWWGWGGVALGAASWVLAWNRFVWFAALQRHTFTPLWIAYILVVNALCVRRSGRCPVTDRPIQYALLFPFSAAFWWFFEYLNRFVQNWYYLGLGDFSGGEYVFLASISFSTVLPAVVSTQALLLTIPALGHGLRHQPPLWIPRPRLWAGAVLVTSGIGLALIGVAPSVLFPLLWVSPLLIVVSLQALGGDRTTLTPVGEGDWRILVAAPLAALVCGWFWEMWNVHSVAKWEYAVPFVQTFHVFEMPILGYGGYLPFGLECIVIAELVFGRTTEATA